LRAVNVDRLVLKMPVRLGPMAKQSPEAQISGGRAAMPFANALRTTRSTLKSELATSRSARPAVAPYQYTVTDWGAGVALGERADGLLVLKWA
jgi:hypothetical protein